jgi:ribosomal protein S12 methylthiotransferase accessory factor
MSRVDLSGLLSVEDRGAIAELTPCGARSSEPAALRVALTPHLERFGITRVANITGLDRLGVPVHVAVRPQGRSLSAGCGKGTTPDASWVSAVMEAAEQSVWEQLEGSSTEANAGTMRRFGCEVVDAHRLPTLSGMQWNEKLPIRWRSGWDILQGEEVWVPDELVTFGRGQISPFVGSTNGLASGGHVLEAVLSGLLELVERDAIARDEVERRDRRVGVASLLHQVAPELAERLHRSRVVLEVRDITTTLGIPVMVALLSDAEGEHLGHFMGAGASTGTSVALVRAVTEAAQSRCVVVAGARDDIFRSERRAALSRLAAAPPVRDDPIPDVTVVDDSHLVGFEDRIEWIADRLESLGCDRIVVMRHSEPGDLVQVVHVVVPGLRWNRLKSWAMGGRALDGAPSGAREAAT